MGTKTGGSYSPKSRGIRTELGTSLVAQWLRIYLPMQGTQVRFLVQEDPHARSNQACVPQLLSLCSRTYVPQQ